MVNEFPGGRFLIVRDEGAHEDLASLINAETDELVLSAGSQGPAEYLTRSDPEDVRHVVVAIDDKRRAYDTIDELIAQYHRHERDVPPISVLGHLPKFEDNHFLYVNHADKKDLRKLTSTDRKRRQRTIYVIDDGLDVQAIDDALSDQHNKVDHARLESVNISDEYDALIFSSQAAGERTKQLEFEAHRNRIGQVILISEQITAEEQEVAARMGHHVIDSKNVESGIKDLLGPTGYSHDLQVTLLDDNETWLTAIKEAFESENYSSVTACRTTEEVVKSLPRTELLVSDFMLGKITSTDFVRMARTLSDLITVIMTGMTSREVSEKLFEHYVNGLVDGVWPKGDFGKTRPSEQVEKLREERISRRYRPAKTDDKPMVYVLFGRGGLGKTSIIKSFVNRYQPQDLEHVEAFTDRPARVGEENSPIIVDSAILAALRSAFDGFSYSNPPPHEGNYFVPRHFFEEGCDYTVATKNREYVNMLRENFPTVVFEITDRFTADHEYRIKSRSNQVFADMRSDVSRPAGLGPDRTFWYGRSAGERQSIEHLRYIHKQWHRLLVEQRQ